MSSIVHLNQAQGLSVSVHIICTAASVYIVNDFASVLQLLIVTWWLDEIFCIICWKLKRYAWSFISFSYLWVLWFYCDFVVVVFFFFFSLSGHTVRFIDVNGCTCTSVQLWLLIQCKIVNLSVIPFYFFFNMTWFDLIWFDLVLGDHVVTCALTILVWVSRDAMDCTIYVYG